MSSKFDAMSAVVRGRCMLAFVTKTMAKMSTPVAANKASATRKESRTLSGILAKESDFL